jgi:D-glycero-alpha-D-manno-heptose-7-phosphate kinase
MIITQTPLRVSFFGGGTDFAEFYRHEEGLVLSSAVDKYIYVIIKERYDDMIRVGYTRTELASSLDEVHHELVRECLRKTGITHKVEISTMGDIPSAGSGLGSSSTVTVGLLNAMYTYLGCPVDANQLAQEACEIEIDVLGKPVGKQDQYIASHGDVRLITFCRDAEVRMERIELEPRARQVLSENLMLFFTNMTRKSETVLVEQKSNVHNHLGTLRALKELAREGRGLLDRGKFDAFGELLHHGWELKKQLASRVTNGRIDAIYDSARRAGALGGKITGAGNGGYLLLYCPHDKQDAVRSALRPLNELPFHLERFGSRVIFNYRR